MTPETLQKALEDIGIMTNSHWKRDTAKEPSWWYVVDESHADPETGYPGDLLSQHDSLKEAQLGRCSAILARLTAGYEVHVDVGYEPINNYPDHGDHI